MTLTETYGRAELQQLYRIALEEYRFEVNLNWERTKFYLTLDSGLAGVGAGLLKIGNAAPVWGQLFAAFIFGIGAVVGVLGRWAIAQGHEYYRHTVFKKTLIEDALGLWNPVGPDERSTLAVGTTSGMRRAREILADPQAYLAARGLRRGSAIHRTSIALLMLSCVNGAGAAVGLYEASSEQWRRADKAKRAARANAALGAASTTTTISTTLTTPPPVGPPGT